MSLKVTTGEVEEDGKLLKSLLSATGSRESTDCWLRPVHAHIRYLILPLPACEQASNGFG